MRMINGPLQTGVVLCGLLVVVYTCSLGATESRRTIQEQPEVTMAIEMAGGKVSGTLRQAPLPEVLEKLSQLGGFTYRLPGNYMSYVVSRQFDQMALIDAIKSILRPFSYVLNTDGKGKLKEVRIVGLQHDADRIVVQEFPTFMPSGKALPSHIDTQPLPVFSPVMHATGPGSGEQKNSGTLPAFEPIINDTGPPYDKRLNTQTLPQFFISLPEGAHKP